MTAQNFSEIQLLLKIEELEAQIELKPEGQAELRKQIDMAIAELTTLRINRHELALMLLAA